MSEVFIETRIGKMRRKGKGVEKAKQSWRKIALGSVIPDQERDLMVSYLCWVK